MFFIKLIIKPLELDYTQTYVKPTEIKDGKSKRRERRKNKNKNHQ